MTMTFWASLALAALAVSSAFAAEALPSPQPRLGLFETAEEIAAGRRRAETEPWAIRQKERILKIADQWVARDDAWIRDIMPKPGSTFAYGAAGCPQCNKPWKSFGFDVASLDRPRVLECPHCKTVFDLNNLQPPYQDTGKGVMVNGRRYFLQGMWNGFVTNQMWSAFGPDACAVVNLKDAYALTGDPRYAHTLIVILDALATLMPTTIGPRDFTDVPNSEQGRLHHLTSIVFRAMMHTTRALDLVGNLPELQQDSPTSPGKSIWDNTRYGLFEEYLFKPIDVRNGKLNTLHNHESDSYRGLVLTGLMFGNPDHIRWGAEGFRAFLDNAIDRDGLYYETSLSYTGFTRGVYIDISELLARYDPADYPAEAGMPARATLPYDGNFFNHPRLARLTLDTPARVSILGREPTYGNNHWDVTLWKKPGRPFSRMEYEQAQRFMLYATDPKIKTHAAQVTAAMLPDADEPPGTGTWPTWSLFHAPDPEQVKLAAGGDAKAPSWDRSDLFGQTSLVFLRSGQDENRRGAVIRSGPGLPHAHDDPGSLLLFARGRALSGDLGYGIFGNHVHLGWATQAIAHHTVVVNQNESGKNKQMRYGPGGTIERFVDAPGVSFVEADLTRQYPASDGIKGYRRLVMQVDVTPEWSYWVDLFDVAGGTIHDYSLHSRPVREGGFRMDGIVPAAVPGAWTLAGLDPAFREASYDQPERSWGERLSTGGMVRKIPGVEDEVPSKGWWYAPPGNGYGFLYDVKAAETARPWTATWRIQDKGEDLGLRLTMLPDQPQRVITASGPTLSGTERMDFVIARNGRPGSAAPIRTRYAGVLEAFGDEPRITGVEPVRRGSQVAGMKVRTAGTEDTIQDARHGAVAGLDNGVGLIRRRAGQLGGLILSGGSALAADGFSLRLSTPAFRGRVTAVDLEANTFQVTPALPASAKGSTLAINNPAYTHGSAYRVAKVDRSGRVTPMLADLTLARSRVDAVAPDGFTSAAPLVTTSLHEQDIPFLNGKRFVAGGKGGRIVTVNAFKNVKTQGYVPPAGAEFVVQDVQPGDTVRMDGTASLIEKDGVWTLLSNVPVQVTFPWPVEKRTTGGWVRARGRTIAVAAPTLAAGPLEFRKAGR